MGQSNIFQSSDFYVSSVAVKRYDYVICLHKRIRRNIGKNPVLIRGFLIEIDERFIVILNTGGYHLAERKNYIVSMYDNIGMYAVHSRVALYYIASKITVPEKKKIDLFNNR